MQKIKRTKWNTDYGWRFYEDVAVRIGDPERIYE